MPNLTLAIDAETAKEMRLHPEIRWTEVARQAIRHKLRELHWYDAALANSELTQKDIDRIATDMKKRMLKKLREQ